MGPQAQIWKFPITSFNIILWIRDRRLRYLGHILRLPGSRLTKQAIQHNHEHPSEGDLLMDVRGKKWKELEEMSADRIAWRRAVTKLKRQAMSKEWIESKSRI